MTNLLISPVKCLFRKRGHLIRRRTFDVVCSGLGTIREWIRARGTCNGQKMPSDPGDPRLGNGATRPERGRFVVQMVSDEVQDLWREGERPVRDRTAG